MADINETGLEGIVNDSVQPGSGSATNVEGGQQGTGNQGQPGKGAWINMLPADLRAGVDVDKYESFGEYIKDLRDKAEGKNARDEKAFTESWDSYVAEMQSSGAMLPESIQGILKDAKVSADVARKLSSAVAEFGAGELAKAEESRRAEMTEYVNSAWKGSFKQNNELCKKALSEFGRKHPDLIRKVNDRKTILFPEFSQLLVDYATLLASSKRETSAPEGTPSAAGGTDSNNPFGLHFD